MLWPSKRFAESDLIPGGAASVGGGAEADDVRDEIDGLVDVPRPGSTQPLPCPPRRTWSTTSRRTRARDESSPKLVRTALARADADADDASDEFFDQDGEELMERLARPVFIGRRPPGSLTTGGAAGLGDIAGKAFRAARNLLNLGTYYEMKGRAGDVGSTGVADLLADLRAANPDLRIHLAGHSFGARTVSAAARAGDKALPVASVSLLQAAFSHFSFADNWEPGKDGLFRSVLATQRVSGPIVVTHTRNDRAVGVAYAIASRVAGQVAQGVGDAGDKYGGLGRNGALKTPEATSGRLLAAGAAAYDLQPGRVHNLLADEFISNHGDVAGTEVAYAVLSAIAVT